MNGNSILGQLLHYTAAHKSHHINNYFKLGAIFTSQSHPVMMESGVAVAGFPTWQLTQ